MSFLNITLESMTNWFLLGSKIPLKNETIVATSSNHTDGFLVELQTGNRWWWFENVNWLIGIVDIPNVSFTRHFVWWLLETLDGITHSNFGNTFWMPSNFGDWTFDVFLIPKKSVLLSKIYLRRQRVLVFNFSTWCSEVSPSKYSSKISMILLALMHFSALSANYFTDSGYSGCLTFLLIHFWTTFSSVKSIPAAQPPSVWAWTWVSTLTRSVFT